MRSAGPHPAAAAGSATTAPLSRRATASKCSLRRGHEEGLARHEEQAAGGGGTPSPPWTGPRFTTTNLGQSWAPQKSGGVQSAAARPARAAAQASSRQRGAWLQSPGCKGVGLITHWTTEAASGADRCGARWRPSAHRRRAAIACTAQPAPLLTRLRTTWGSLRSTRTGPQTALGPMQGLGSFAALAPPCLFSSCSSCPPAHSPYHPPSPIALPRLPPPPPSAAACLRRRACRSTASSCRRSSASRSMRTRSSSVLPGARQGGRQRHSRLRVQLEQYRWRTACGQWQRWCEGLVRAVAALVGGATLPQVV